MTDETEKLRLIEALAKVLLAASEAMERSDWSAVEKACYSGARQNRSLLLIERQAAREKDQS